MDHAVKFSASERMRKVKSMKTKLELYFASLLAKNKIRYRSHPNIYGHPDFRLVGVKMLVFCDSSFWHGRREKEISGKAFKKNKKFWITKLVYNKTRDRQITLRLKEKGWNVLRFWDDDIYKHSEKVISEIKRYG